MNLILDHPDVAAFLSTLPPDSERDRRTATLRTAAQWLTRALADSERIPARLQAITASLVDADEPERARLYIEYPLRVGERERLPTVVHGAARRFGEALAAWAMDVSALASATATGRAAATAIDADIRRWFPNVVDCAIGRDDIDRYAAGVVMQSCGKPPPPTAEEFRARLRSDPMDIGVLERKRGADPTTSQRVSRRLAARNRPRRR